MSAAESGARSAGRTVIVLAAIAIATVGVHLGREVLPPFLLALVVVVIVHPVRRKLLQRGFPNWVACSAVVGLAWAVLLSILALVVVSGGQFDRLIHEYGAEIADAVAQVSAVLDGLGYAVEPRPVDPELFIKLVAAATSAVASLTVAIAMVLTYILFMAFDAKLLDDTAERFADQHGRLISAFATFGTSVRSYFIVNTIFGAAVALCDGLVLWLLDVPGVLIWVMLAFVTNFIPSIGFVIGLVPPVLLALLTGGWQTAAVVLIAYCVINIALQTFVQPRVVSSTVRLNLTLTFFSVVFWSAVLGPIGAVLSIPMTLLVRTVLLETTEHSTFARWLSGDRASP